MKLVCDREFHGSGIAWTQPQGETIRDLNAGSELRGTDTGSTKELRRF
jgi:hypothetical protein